MTNYEYKVVPAPDRGKRARGVKGTNGRFAHALECVMNELAADGWEYWRSDTLPCEERTGLTSSRTSYKSILIFRRSTSAEAEDLQAPFEQLAEAVARHALPAVPVPSIPEHHLAEETPSEEDVQTPARLPEEATPEAAEAETAPEQPQDVEESEAPETAGSEAAAQFPWNSTLPEDQLPEQFDWQRSPEDGHLMLTDPVSIPERPAPKAAPKEGAFVSDAAASTRFVPDEDEGSDDPFPNALPAALLARARRVSDEGEAKPDKKSDLAAE
ncbi:DUF4177 domain-containing protein [Shimia sp. CNT1-13L.2]|uniref:DUF4177 domain-containing protein n=1 Tax=Shimia sp. CNT1-13L.2 TaxID=2959663 RepID=UPI0020CDB28F|nr:DUF4177 domain-containing protein [Shimia sp. CNT1-13L.2]